MTTLTNEHSSYLDMKSRWDACEAAAEGEHAIHAARETYLPKLTEEGDQEYNLRLKMTPFFNATWRTIAGMKGMLFRKPPKVEAPSALEELLKNVDAAGTDMLTLANEVVAEALKLGRIGLLVDYPTAPEGLTLADAKQQGLRPMISVYKAVSIYNWKETTINGLRQLTHIRLVEETEVQDSDDEFTVKTEKRYRVLDLEQGDYRQRLFKIAEDGNPELISEVFPMMGGRRMAFIPFAVIGVDHLGIEVEAPPLIDLVTTNLHHYLQATSYERGCFFSGLPTMFISGMSDADGEIAIGGPIANALGNPAAKAYYVEVSSKFEALRTNLEDKKREMAVLGARMLEGGKTGGNTEAAETVARRQSGEESVLAAIAFTVSEGLTQALKWLAEWAGVTGEVRYQLNRDFLPMPMTAGELSALVSAWQNGAISQQTLFNNLKQGEIISDEDTLEDEQERIAAAQADLQVQQQAQVQADAEFQLQVQARQQELNQ